MRIIVIYLGFFIFLVALAVAAPADPQNSDLKDRNGELQVFAESEDEPAPEAQSAPATTEKSLRDRIKDRVGKAKEKMNEAKEKVKEFVGKAKEKAKEAVNKIKDRID